jgi:hypothetical protein
MECLFDLTNKNQVEKFTATDPYNIQNTLQGYINKRQGQLYGSIWITHVNDKEVPQLIYSSPKQHYPFDKEGKWEFPECDCVELYEKLDGTCVISYTYRDAIGNIFLTFKTRLRPFLGEGKYGNFFALWNEMLTKYPDINELCNTSEINFVFELYGKRNRILVDYDVPLETKLIFYITNQDGGICPPKNINLSKFHIPVLLSDTLLTSITKDGYENVQSALESNLIIDIEKQVIKGKEGVVMYFL